MAKIYILANDTTYTYNLRDQIIERLIADGNEVTIVSQTLLFCDELHAMGCKTIDININRHGKNPFSDFTLFFWYWKIIRKGKPDIVLCYNIKPNSYGGIACRLTKTRYIPNITGLGTPLERPGTIQKIAVRLYRMGVADASCIMFQNEENKQFFYNHKMIRNKTRAHLLPGSGVNLKKQVPMDYPDEKDGINFLFIARLMKEKGIDLYINAAKRIHEKCKQTRFHICGYCDDRKYLRDLQQLEKEGYIVYHGEQKDLRPFFEKAHCIVHPSYYPEGISNVLLEAAAHCRPVITTDRSGCRETVDDGATGFIIPINNEDALVDSMTKFIEMSWQKKKEMGLEGRKKIEKVFDRRIVAEAYSEEIGYAIRPQA